MEELDLFSRMNAISEVQAYTSILGVDEEYAAMISEHKYQTTKKRAETDVL